jgi:hypothetical protein
MSQEVVLAPERRPADDVTIIREMSTISPELALVDPTLAETARARLPDPPDCLAPRARPVVPRATATRMPSSSQARRVRPVDDPPPPRRCERPAQVEVAAAPRRHRRLRSVSLAGAWVVAALFVLSPLLAFRPTPSSQLPRIVSPGSVAAVQDGAEPSSKDPVVVARKPRVTKTDKTPTPVRPKPSVPPRAKAAKSAKPAATSSPPTVITWPAVRAAVVYNIIFVAGDERIDVWSKDNRLALDGTPRAASAEETEYAWFAYAGFREGKAVRYGSLVAHGTALVARGAIPETQPPAGGQVR